MNVVSLFSGAGGLDLGFIMAGHNIIWANDLYSDAVATYRRNIGNHIVERDIKEIPSNEIPDCDIVISGERTCYLIPKTPDFVTHVRDVVGNHVTVVDSPERIEEEIIKISYFAEPDKQKAATDQFMEKFADRINFYS